MAKVFNTVPEWRNFGKSGHTESQIRRGPKTPFEINKKIAFTWTGFFSHLRICLRCRLRSKKFKFNFQNCFSSLKTFWRLSLSPLHAAPLEGDIQSSAVLFRSQPTFISATKTYIFSFMCFDRKLLLSLGIAHGGVLMASSFKVVTKTTWPYR